MSERRQLITWKEIATYLSRGVRTVQRWESQYKLPVHRVNNDAGSVFAFADEIDSWLDRTRPRGDSYVRPTFIVLDVVTPSALSNLKLGLETAKFNVLTAFTASELFATAERYNVDGFLIDAVVLDMAPEEIGARLKHRFPDKVRVLIGEEHDPAFDATLPAADLTAIIGHLIDRFGLPRIV